MVVTAAITNFRVRNGVCCQCTRLCLGKASTPNTITLTPEPNIEFSVLFSWVTWHGMLASKPARRPCSGRETTLYAAITGVALQNSLFAPTALMHSLFLLEEGEGLKWISHLYPNQPNSHLARSQCTSEYEPQVNLGYFCSVTFPWRVEESPPIPNCWHSSSLDPCF